MTVLIIGYPDSGKSRLAEDMVMEMSSAGERIYLATMIPYGEEGRARIEKHRKMREGRGFETIEAPYDAANAIADAYSRDAVKTKTVLLECLSNLVANEMFERHTDTDLLIEKLTADIQKLAGSCRNLVIVSNHFDIDAGFDDETRAYASIMDAVNDRISNIADKTVHI